MKRAELLGCTGFHFNFNFYSLGLAHFMLFKYEKAAVYKIVLISILRSVDFQI
jgi:hypothetical protein